MKIFPCTKAVAMLVSPTFGICLLYRKRNTAVIE